MPGTVGSPLQTLLLTPPLWGGQDDYPPRSPEEGSPAWRGAALSVVTPSKCAAELRLGAGRRPQPCRGARTCPLPSHAGLCSRRGAHPRGLRGLATPPTTSWSPQVCHSPCGRRCLTGVAPMIHLSPQAPLGGGGVSAEAQRRPGIRQRSHSSCASGGARIPVSAAVWFRPRRGRSSTSGSQMTPQEGRHRPRDTAAREGGRGGGRGPGWLLRGPP